MDLIPLVGSSRIRAYGWEESPVNRQLFKGKLDGRAQRRERSGLLQIEFTDGARWYYFDVPVLIFDAWMLSRSKGSFFHRYIRGHFNERTAAEVERQQSAG